MALGVLQTPHQHATECNEGVSVTGAVVRADVSPICRYGKTASDRLVDMEAVEQLQAMGYDRRLCAEALRSVRTRPGKLSPSPV